MNRSIVLAFIVCCISLRGDGGADDYKRAARLLPSPRYPIIVNAQVNPNWVGKEDRFWYRRVAPEAILFLKVDIKAKSRVPAFDHEKLAAGFSSAAGKQFPANRLPFERFEFIDGEKRIRFDAVEKQWTCDLVTYLCRETPQSFEVVSPDKKWVAYQKNHNVFVRSTVSNEEIQLSTDGSAHRDYSSSLPSLRTMVQQNTMNVNVQPALRWSPDSTKLAAYRLDRRSAGQLTVVQSVPKQGIRPVSYTYPYPLPGDLGLTRAEPVVFDVLKRRQIEVKTEPIELLFLGGPNFQWFTDSRRLRYIHTDRGYQKSQLREIDAETGSVRVLVEERSETFIDPGMTYFRILEESNEVIWSSERDGWCHLYLYDSKSGQVKRQLTSGQWVVRSILHVDGKKRQVYFTGGGREPKRDPYLVHVYRIGLDGGAPKLLTPEDAEHVAEFSPTGAFFVDTWSRIDVAPRAAVRSATDGSVVMELEQADVKPLVQSGWKWPEPFNVLADDKTTELYGVLYKPSTFDPAKKYPVIEEMYTGPHSYHTPKSFRAQSAAQAVAELGFIVVFLDARGTGKRSKAFHDYAYKDLGGSVGLKDHIHGIRQLGERFPFMDLSRVGVFGHSAGGYDSTHALLTHPEFYKVAVSSAGNHDHRSDKAWWNELWMGFPVGDHYHQQSNVTLASKLEGKLMLVHGELDDNVHPAATMQLVDALIKANKDFELLIMPGKDHGLGSDSYFIRRRWDFFVRHLMGSEPPRNFKIAEPGT